MVNSGKKLTLTNITVEHGDGISSGGIYSDDGSTDPSVITMTNVTLKDNGAVQGGGFYDFNAPDTHAYLKNTVLADSTSAGNCSGKAFGSATYSLSSTGNQTGVAARLYPLAPVAVRLKCICPCPTAR